MSAARFEIVRSHDIVADSDRWWARFRAANSQIVWTTETYRRRAGAENAILSIATGLGVTQPELVENVPGREHILRSAISQGPGLSVLTVDERTKP